MGRTKTERSQPRPLSNKTMSAIASRLAAGETRQEIAEQAGVGRDAVGKLRAGRPVSLAALDAVASACGLRAVDSTGERYPSIAAAIDACSLKVSQKELAATSGIVQQRLSRYRHGHEGMRSSQADRLAWALGIRLEDST